MWFTSAKRCTVMGESEERKKFNSIKVAVEKYFFFNTEKTR